MRVRKKPVEVDVTQWFKNGDHPKDNCASGSVVEGDVVRYFNRPDTDHINCNKCNTTMGYHGWIDTLEGGHIVCPGDFIITGVEGERYPCKPDIFWKTYEEVEGEHDTKY